MKTDNLPKPSSVVNLAGQREKDHLVPYSHLLVPVDFSEHSKKTLEYATQLAGFTGGTPRRESVDALKFYRKLAERDPETYLPGVAATLTTLG